MWHLLQGLGLATFTGYEDSFGAITGAGSPLSLLSKESKKQGHEGLKAQPGQASGVLAVSHWTLPRHPLTTASLAASPANPPVVVWERLLLIPI